MGEVSSPLFTLPLELREEVYRNALCSSAYGTSILRTCREIHTEACKFLYQRPLRFRNQDAWFAWLNQVPAELLGHVSEIALHVQDIDLKPILERNISKPLRQSPRLQTAELYQQNVDMVKQGLLLLPHLNILTISAPSSRPSHLYCELMTQILDSIGFLCPQLTQLRLEGNFRHHTLNFLSNIANLNSLALEGSTQSTPESTAKILSTIPHLASLSLISNCVPLSSDPRQHRACTTQRYSFSGETLRKVQKLDLLSLTENGLLPPPRACLTTNALDALHDHTTLKSLCIRLANTPDTTIFTSMTKFLKRTPIEHLELDWPNLQALELERYHLLASSLRVLWIRIGSVSSAIEILRFLAQCLRERCSQLQQVVLVRSRQLFTEMPRHLVGSAQLAKDDEIGTDLSCTRQRLRIMGIHVAWYTEEM